MEYYCDKPHHSRELLSRSFAIEGPDGIRKVTHVETCPVCLEETAKRTLDKIRALVKD